MSYSLDGKSRQAAKELCAVLRSINSKPYPFIHRLQSQAEPATNYVLAIVAYPDTTYLSKEIVEEVCRFWAKMDVMTRYADYQALERLFSKLTNAVRDAYQHFHLKWNDADEVFQEFVTVNHQDIDDAHDENVRNRLLALELSKLSHFLNKKGLHHHLEEFWTQVAKQRDEELHP